MKKRHLVEFSGKIIETTVTNEAAVAQDWVQRIVINSNSDQIRVIALGCKFIHHPIRSMSNKIAILQLCIDTSCLLLQLLHLDDIPQSLGDFLWDPRTTFVGVDIQENSLKLFKEYQLIVNRKVDIHFLAKQWFPVRYKAKPSLKGLAYGVVGFSMRKSSESNYKGNWESRVLDEELVAQACVDAYTCYAIACKLLRDDDP